MEPTEEQRRDWTSRLERLGEAMVRSDIQLRHGVGIGFSGDAMLQVAAAWLRDKERAREERERLAYVYAKWTLAAAIAAVIVGVIGLTTTILTGH
jgi:hypothetical protein